MTAAWQELEALQALATEKKRREGKADAVVFAKMCGISPDPWQEKVLRSQSKRILLNCSRQSGKSTVSSLVACHHAVYNPGSTVLLISPSLRQSGELLRKVRDRLANLPGCPDLDAESKTTIELPNKSRIISLPATESTIRTFTANLIIEDEAGDVPDDLFTAILPMLIVSRGRLVLAGTPKGRAGHFFEAWERGGAGWERYEISWDKCPRIDPKDIAIQQVAMRDKFIQEYCCQFIMSGGGMVYGAFDEQRNLLQTLPVDPNGTPVKWTYLLGMDFGFVDATAYTVLAYRPQDPTAYIVLSFKEVGQTPSMVGAKVLELNATFKFAKIIGDIGGLGKGYSEEMRRRFRIPVEPAEKQNKRGYIDLFNGALATGDIKILRDSCTELIQEMTSLPWSADRSKEHPGFADHCCDSALYIWRAATMYLNEKPKPQVQVPIAKKHQEEVDAFWKADAERRAQARNNPDGEVDIF